MDYIDIPCFVTRRHLIGDILTAGETKKRMTNQLRARWGSWSSGGSCTWKAGSGVSPKDRRSEDAWRLSSSLIFRKFLPTSQILLPSNSTQQVEADRLTSNHRFNISQWYPQNFLHKNTSHKVAPPHFPFENAETPKYYHTIRLIFAFQPYVRIPSIQGR